jgi:uncharacterized protein YjiS (DUF1127 family)
LPHHQETKKHNWMELIVSTISSPMISGDPVVVTLFRVVGRVLKNWWIAYITWRVEQIAISRLRSMSDRELADIGICRANIEFAARSGSDRHAMMSRYF